MKRFALIVLPVIAIILELLPNGAVLNFANPENTAIQNTYSYFSLTPFGYANFGPFLTAMLTCVLFALTVFHTITKNDRLDISVKIVSVITVLTSLMPLLYGFDCFSLVGAIISIVLFAEMIVSITNQKYKNRKLIK